MITAGSLSHLARSSLAARRPGPSQLSQRKFPGSVFVQLVGDGIPTLAGYAWTSASLGRRCSGPCWRLWIEFWRVARCTLMVEPALP
jgi:hypothetical protein